MATTDLYNAEFMDHVSHPDYKYELEDADALGAAYDDLASISYLEFASKLE